jgi:hypothetical protein
MNYKANGPRPYADAVTQGVLVRASYAANENLDMASIYEPNRACFTATFSTVR